MYGSVPAGVALESLSVESIRPSDEETLSKLISAACASLDSDRARAREYMQRAAALLRISHEGRRTAPAAMCCIRGGLASWQQKRVMAYVESNIGSSIRTIDLAGIVRLSKAHFFRAFRNSFGESPMEYVAKRRVVLGQELMRNSRASLSEIALACGMCDQAHFTRVFHRIVGVSPGLWRRECATGGAGAERSAPRASATLRLVESGYGRA
jgi:AraC family transcriptional regulator